MKFKKIESVDELVLGRKFLEVEAFADGRWYHVSGPYEIIGRPSEGIAPSRHPLASKWWVLVREKGGNAKNTFPISFPCVNGKIVRRTGDYSAFFVHTPEVEQKLRAMKSLGEYRREFGV